MVLSLPNVKKINQESGISGIYKAIAYAGHICYASTKQGDEQEFVERCIKMHHYRPLEFGTVYLYVDYNEFGGIYHNFYDRYKSNHYSRVEIDNDSNLYITTNYRVIVENNWIADLNYLSECKKYHIPRYTVHWTISRGIADEFRTHTTISSLMQSTRYCNYAKDKFGNQLTFIKPEWVSTTTYDACVTEQEREFFKQLEKTEYSYLKLIELGCSAQQARDVLPLSIKTEFVQCAFYSDWIQFFNQRVHGTTGVPHPDAQAIAIKAMNLLNF